MARDDAGVAADYRARLADRRATLDGFERRHALVSRIRLALAGAAGIVVLVRGRAGLPWAGVLAVAFLAAVVVHARVLAARARARRAVGWYEQGIRRLTHTWMGHGDPGERFRPGAHVYADDLDVFGRGGLFELLSTPRTLAGQTTLAAWLLEAAPPAVVSARQDAVRELAGRADLREAIAVLGEDVHVEATSLRSWAASPPAFAWRVWPILLALLSSATIAALGVYLAGARLSPLLLGLFGLQMAVARALQARVREVLHRVASPARDLVVLAGLLRVLERTAFEAPALRRLVSAVTAGSQPASREIAGLDRLVGCLAWRQNLIFALPAALMLWATQVALAVDRWRRRVRVSVPGWLDAVGELEALAALATLAAEHPGWAFPALGAGAARLEAAGLAHPLLPADAVPNDVALGGQAPAVLIVSGSNMSGKSTLLRAIGVNVVLAQAGGPVRARSCRLSPLVPGTSIRVVDSLQDGTSRFFAEISRLKVIVDLGRRHPDGLLFLLDEILGGTNSHDRAHGAAALVAGLVRTGAIGLVTTHDLALSRLADDASVRAVNVHFADRFDEGGLQFDYRMRPGPVRTSNALALMRSVGLDV